METALHTGKQGAEGAGPKLEAEKTEGKYGESQRMEVTYASEKHVTGKRPKKPVGGN